MALNSCKSMRGPSQSDYEAFYYPAVEIRKKLDSLLPQMAEQKEALQQMMNRMQIAAKPMDQEKFERWEKLQLELGEMEREIKDLEEVYDSGSVASLEKQLKFYEDLDKRVADLMERVGEEVG